MNVITSLLVSLIMLPAVSCADDFFLMGSPSFIADMKMPCWNSGELGLRLHRSGFSPVLKGLVVTVIDPTQPIATTYLHDDGRAAVTITNPDGSDCLILAIEDAE